MCVKAYKWCGVCGVRVQRLCHWWMWVVVGSKGSEVGTAVGVVDRALQVER